MLNKQELRKEMRAKRNMVNASENRNCSEMICRKILNLPEFLACETILLYHSTQNEIDTTYIFQEAKKRGLRVGYPKVIGDTMRFFLVNSLEELKEGYMGIFEPDEKIAEAFEPHEGICIVPGTAFDCHCNRIGYGKAFYDRFLHQFPTLITIGIAYDFQIVEELPCEPHDIALNYIITESRVFKHE